MHNDTHTLRQQLRRSRATNAVLGMILVCLLVAGVCLLLAR